MKRSQHGFTLLETLVAVSLLMLSIVGPLTIAQKSVKTSTYTKNRTTAYYLAQDAQEFLRNIRDTNSLAGGTWSTLGGVYGPCVNGKCDVDTQYSPSQVISNSATRAQAIQSCGTTNCPTLTFVDDPTDLHNGYFGHKVAVSTTIVESQYRREITITPLNTSSPDSRELLIRVDVIWHEGILGGEKKISLYDEVYDWQ
ncbi:MAG: prepilin-type N-terminal cleavage/methylation domain-containing protein [bacterium]